jgi:hypothetical protein
MTVNNPWVGYLERSYLQIKNSLLQRLGEIAPEVTDHSESNILVIILSQVAGVAEMLNYYIDNMAREAFISTARRYSSVVKHTRLIDYRIKAIIPASTDLQLTFLNNLGQSIANDAIRTIPKGTIFKTLNNTEFISTSQHIIPIGVTNYTIPVEQKTFSENVLIGTIDGTEDQVFSLGNNYVNESIYLEVGGDVWELVNTLGRSGPLDKHFIVEVSVDRIAYIKFGDGINGMLPPVNSDLIADYYISEGALGNVDANTINSTTFNFIVLGSNVTTVNLTNPLKAVGGTDYESIERIRRSAPLSLRTLDRAVTKQDFIDVAMLAPGVDKATVHYNCGKFVDIYISPNGGGIAQVSLLENTFNYINDRKTITTFINVVPAGESYITLGITATAKFRRNGIQTASDIVTALTEAYSYENSNVNRKIRKSDIIALVDNLEKVDYVNLDYLYLKPYFRPHNQHSQQLLTNIEILNGSTVNMNWRLQYTGDYMRLFKNGLFIANLNIGEQYTEPNNVFKLTILPSSYEFGQEWVFKTYPYNENLETDDFSVPILDASNLSIEVIEQLSIN